MKILIDESDQYDEVEVIIKCPSYDDEIVALVGRMKNPTHKISGQLDGKTYFFEENDIYYFDSVDKKCFFYTKDGVYETHHRLYELESKLKAKGFFRATKSTIINISKIKSIKSEFNSNISVIMENGEKLLVSRQYAPILKSVLLGGES